MPGPLRLSRRLGGSNFGISNNNPQKRSTDDKTVWLLRSKYSYDVCGSLDYVVRRPTNLPM